MFYFINTNTNTYPYYLGNIQNDYPSYNVYQPLPEGIFRVEPGIKPSDPDEFHTYSPSQPELVDGIWTMQYVLIELPFDQEKPPLPDGPGPWLWDDESKNWYLANPLAKETHD
jgi:hypothetical protein